MASKYRFVTTGDFVEFYDDAMLVTTLHKTSRVITWNYDGTPGIIFAIANLKYHTDNVADISFDGVALTTQGGFETAILSMFPSYGGGYLVYTALLNQTGAGAPEETFLWGTLIGGDNPTWARADEGEYTATLEGAFPTSTFITIGSIEGAGFINAFRFSDDVIKVNTFDLAGAAADSLLVNTAIEIRIYTLS